MEQIKTTQRQILIQDICGDIGYSKRYIDKLFQTHIGVPPKLISSIERFQSI